MLSKNSANWYSGVPTIDTIGFKGIQFLQALAIPYNLRGLLPNETTISISLNSLLFSDIFGCNSSLNIF